MISKVLDGSSFVDEFLEYMLSNYSDKNSQLSVDILDVKNLTSFVRTNQEFYILWEILLGANLNKANTNVDSLLNDIKLLLNLLKNTEEKPVDNDYVLNFTETLRSIRNKYA